MARSALVLIAVLFAAPAWAVGERISVGGGPAYMEQLRETLCVSMECGRGVDASVAAKTVKGKAEIKVLSASGAVKATITAPVNADGRIGSMDLVAATSGIIQAIEGNLPAKAEKSDSKPEKASKKSKALAAKAKKKAGFKVAAKARSSRSRG